MPFQKQLPIASIRHEFVRNKSLVRAALVYLRPLLLFSFLWCGGRVYGFERTHNCTSLVWRCWETFNLKKVIYYFRWITRRGRLHFVASVLSFYHHSSLYLYLYFDTLNHRNGCEQLQHSYAVYWSDLTLKNNMELQFPTHCRTIPHTAVEDEQRCWISKKSME